MRPKKSLGQHFLTDPNYKRKILSVIGPASPKKILEIGPGRGALTNQLANQADWFCVVEKDRALAGELKEALPHAVVLAEDFLDIDLPKVLGMPARDICVIGNLPYNAASQIFIKLIGHREYFSQLFLMFQKEMALRFVATPQTKDYGLLTLWAAVYSDCKILFHVPPTAFFPKPKVRSSFVNFKIREKPLLDDEEAPFFWGLMRSLFQQRRKTIGSVLRKTYGRTPWDTQRAEALSVKELIELAKAMR